MDEMDILLNEIFECGDMDLFNPIPTDEEMEEMAQELDDVLSHDINDELFIKKVHREIGD